MTRITTTPLAVSADYADALLAARRAKNWSFLLLMLFLIVQIAVFFLVRYDKLRVGGPDADATVRIETPASGPSETTKSTEAKVKLDDVASYATGFIVFAGAALAIIMAVMVLLIALIMLQGRLIGVAHVTSAFIWAVLLVVLLLPWQRFYSGGAVSPATSSVSSRDDFRLPGVLYTWPELTRDAHFRHDPLGTAVLKYVRYVGAPVFALVVLFMVQAKSGRGVKYALGEAEVHVDVTTTETDRL